MASTRFVLPWPLRPRKTVTPGSRSSSSARQLRNSLSSRRVIRIRAPSSLGSLHRVASELLAQRGDGLHRRRILLPGDEAGEDGGADGRNRDGIGDGFLDRPAPLPRILDVALDVLEVGIG